MRKRISAKTARRLAFLIVLGAVAARYLTTQQRTLPQPQIVVATRGDIVETVTLTGAIAPAERVELAFERAGTVSSVAVDIGTTVNRGQILATLDTAELTAQLQQSQAALASAEARREESVAVLASQEAKLAELQGGSRPEELAIKQAELRQAEQELANASATVPDTLNDAFSAADDAVRVKTSVLFSRTETTFQITYQTCNTQAESDATWGRLVSEQTLTAWQMELAGLTANAAARDDAIRRAAAALTQIKLFLERTHETLTTECARIDPALPTARANLSQAREAVVSALGKVNALAQTIAAKQRALERIQREEELTVSGPRPEQIQAQAAVVRQFEAAVAAQTALVEQARANRQIAQVQLDKAILRAPFAGVVTTLAAKVGQSVAPAAPLISLITADQLEITAQVPEADIARLAIGQTASITLDAYGDAVEFSASIYAIDPAETVIDGVPTYGVTLRFTTTDPRLKSGMTANCELTTARRVGVIVLPARAIRTSIDGPKVLLHQPDGNTRLVPVTTGARAANGDVEILSGVIAGDMVEVPPA